MPYIELATSRYPVSEREIRDAHPNLTFASPFSPDGYALVFQTPQPAHSAISGYVREVSPVLTNKGVWEQHWEVLALPAEQIAANQADAQAALWEQIKAKRDAIKHGGVNVSGKWFHTDDSSRIQQLGLVMMGAAVPAVEWKTMDGSFVTMSQTLAVNIFNAVAQLDMSAFQVAESHRAAMMALDNPTGYDFSTGWPEVFA